MPLEFEFLADRVEALSVVSKWYFDEWGTLSEHHSLERFQKELSGHLNRDSIPFTLLAIKDKKVLGAAQLKHHELIESFPDKEHWLSGMFVRPEHRGQGYGSKIIEHMTKIAPLYGVRTLHLQTEKLDGGLYARLGWIPVTVAKNCGLDVLVMERHLRR